LTSLKTWADLPKVASTGGVNACNKKYILHVYSVRCFTFWQLQATVI